MALSSLESRLPPLGNTFLDADGDDTLELDALHMSMEEHRPRRLLKQRSFHGYFPYLVKAELERVVSSQPFCAKSMRKAFAFGDTRESSKAETDPMPGAASWIRSKIEDRSEARQPKKADDNHYPTLLMQRSCFPTTSGEKPLALGTKELCIVAPVVPAPQDCITTLMIRNLPYSISQDELIDDLNACGFRGLYDFLYMPYSFEGQSGKAVCKGYAFVNFISSAPARELVTVWHLSLRFGMSNQDQALNLSAASLQGFDANVAKWSTPRMRRVRNPNCKPFVAGHPAPAAGRYANAGKYASA